MALRTRLEVFFEISAERDRERTLEIVAEKLL
jgi:hypothetical protein